VGAGIRGPGGIVGAMHGNAGFWKFFVATAAGGVLLVVLVIAFRPVARSGAVAFAQSNLRAAADAAERIAEDDGSLVAPTALRMRTDAGLDDLLFIDPDVASNDSEIVSVWATDEAWTGAARADTGDCFWVRIEVSGDRSFGTGTDCSAEEAADAPAGGWPDP
jgi:hypothetical protein